MSKKKYGIHTEQISEYDVHVGIKKVELPAEVEKSESLEEFDKRLAKIFRKDIEITIVLIIAIITLATFFHHLFN